MFINDYANLNNCDFNFIFIQSNNSINFEASKNGNSLKEHSSEELFNMLKCKENVQKYGITFKKCYVYGYINKEVRNLKVKESEYLKYLKRFQQDMNAAINIIKVVDIGNIKSSQTR